MTRSHLFFALAVVIFCSSSAAALDQAPGKEYVLPELKGSPTLDDGKLLLKVVEETGVKESVLSYDYVTGTEELIVSLAGKPGSLYIIGDGIARMEPADMGIGWSPYFELMKRDGSGAVFMSLDAHGNRIDSTVLSGFNLLFTTWYHVSGSYSPALYVYNTSTGVYTAVIDERGASPYSDVRWDDATIHKSTVAFSAPPVAGSSQKATHWDLYVRGPGRDNEIARFGRQRYPAISGDWIAFYEFLGNTELTAISLYNTNTREFRNKLGNPIKDYIYAPSLNAPAISGNYVIFFDRRPNNSSDYPGLVLYDISTSKEWLVAGGRSKKEWPSIRGNQILWRQYHEELHTALYHVFVLGDLSTSSYSGTATALDLIATAQANMNLAKKPFKAAKGKKAAKIKKANKKIKAARTSLRNALKNLAKALSDASIINPAYVNLSLKSAKQALSICNKACSSRTAQKTANKLWKQLAKLLGKMKAVD